MLIYTHTYILIHIYSYTSRRDGLGMSLFERLEQADHEVVMLSVQYRMCSDIRIFPSLRFYQGQLKDACEDQSKPPTVLSFLRLCELNAMSMYDLSSYSREEKVGMSYINVHEAKFIVKLLYERIYTKLVTIQGSSGYSYALQLKHIGSIGIISPYKAQIRELRNMLVKVLPTEMYKHIEVNTVDGFQGFQSVVVVWYCVLGDSGGV